MGIPTALGGTAFTQSTPVTTITITYTPTAGNTVVLFLQSNGISAVTVQDNHGNALTAGATSILNGGAQSRVFYGTAAATVTGYTASWTTSSGMGISIEEYSGVISVSAALTGNTATGSSSPATISQVVPANSMIVAGFDTRTSSPTATVGTQRQISTAANPQHILMDNSTVGAQTLSCACTFTALTWSAAALVLVGGSGTTASVTSLVGW